MYVDIEKVEVTKDIDGTIQETTEKYDKVFLAKVRAPHAGVLNTWNLARAASHACDTARPHVAAATGLFGAPAH